MARQRKMTPERRAFINSLLEHYHPSDAQDVQEMLKGLLGIPCRACWKQKWMSSLDTPSMISGTKKRMTVGTAAVKKL